MARNKPWILILYFALYCSTQGLYDAWDEGATRLSPDGARAHT